MKTVTWSVRLTSVPTADRYCKRCGKKAEFASSGLFRVNAQQKSLDVRLVYKCCSCDTTWNLTILSRVNPQSIPTEMLNGFHQNDSMLATLYASDSALVKRNGGEPRLPDFDVVGDDEIFSEPTRIRIFSEYPLEIKLSAVLRNKLGLSRSAFDKLCDSGKLCCTSGQDIGKCKLSGTIIVETK